MVLAYDPLQDRRTIDVITTTVFPLCFKMAHDWAKDKVQRNLVEALNRYEKHSLAGGRRIKPFLF